ncbi:hypothetical protein [Singulisphaera sp. PoT]|uniref:hypothetical protein n=1 Tax=Singulisphaera sp. PoT TaxID=3411797 RepID=UPI003BF5E58A
MAFSMIVVLAALALDDKDAGTLDAGQFSKMLGALHSRIRDCEFICGGSVTFVDPEDPDRSKSERVDKSYQAIYARRSEDGARILELYVKPNSSRDQAVRRRLSILRDHKAYLELDHAYTGMTGSPQRFLYLEFWDDILPKLHAGSYQFQGWEDIDGHRCARVVILPEANVPGASSHLLWVDLERGGHVLKHEFRSNGDLWYAMGNVKLARISLRDGKTAWLPVHGEFSSFLNGNQFKLLPVIKEVYDVEESTIRLNRGFEDDRFAVFHDNSKKAPAFDKLRAEFRATSPGSRTP